jgi:hypothetical protein
MVTMATNLFTAVNLVKLNYIELNAVKASSLKLVSLKLGSSTLLHVGKVGELVLPRTSCL